MHEHQSPILCVFLFCGILLGSLIAYILTRSASPLPYTVVIFFLGTVVAVVATKVPLGDLGDSIYFWKNLDPEIILFLFLPILVFGEAMTLKW